MAASTIPYTIPGTVDQEKPELVARLSFEDAQSSDPLTWVDVSSRLRGSFSVSRGAENELEHVDTGIANVLLDNRDRALDPFNTSSAYSPNVKPRRRLWLQSQWDGVTKDLFYGWTGGFKPEWPDGMDAVVPLSAQDGFATLAGNRLPTTSPPRDSYADLLQYDKPYLLCPLNEPSAVFEVVDVSEHNRNPVYAPTLAPTFGLPGGVIGQRDTAAGNEDLTSLTWTIDASPISDVPGYFGSHNQLTVEMLYFRSGEDSATNFNGPVLQTSGEPQWRLFEQGTGSHTFRFQLRVGGANQTIDSTTVTVTDAWYHVVGTWDGANKRIYVNGAQQNSSAQTGTFNTDTVINTGMTIGFQSQSKVGYMVIYDYALSAARVAAHYTAAREMGLMEATSADHHIAELLEETGLAFVPRRLRTGQREIQAVYFTGQSPIEPLQETCRAEGDPAMCFFAGDGAIVFLDKDHRSVSPWSTVQATFDDDLTDLPYLSLEIDDGEAFIYNDVRVTAKGGTLQRRTNTASQTEYGKDRVLDRGETLNVDDTDAGAEADALLAKYKDPLARITALVLKGEDPSLLTAMLARELGDRIRVFRRPPGGGSAIDTTLFIRKIDLSGTAPDGGDPYWTVRWAVSQR